MKRRRSATEEEQSPLKCLEEGWAPRVVTVMNGKMRIPGELTKTKACQLQKRQPGLGEGVEDLGGHGCREEIATPYKKRGRDLEKGRMTASG